MLNRRTFAIISHPDAGKTTLTEKLLLLGGAIHLAGEVRAKGQRRRTRSDWMAIERRRGISVTTSVMTFPWRDCVFNLLDTPGHEDFSEDTFRTLTAVDSAIMVLDAARGIETQTLKLFEICRLRDIPIITFINKMDREPGDLLALMDEIASKLALDVVPMVWPLGEGRSFAGLYDMPHKTLLLGEGEDSVPTTGFDDPHLTSLLSEEHLKAITEGAALAHTATPEFSLESYRAGHMTPVYFGSALKNFGVRTLLDAVWHYAPHPGPQPLENGEVSPDHPKVSGFVFKIQANMDPQHRDRMAYVRLCSGHFRRGMRLYHVRTGKMMTISAPTLFFAQSRAHAEEAEPGDIIGVPNHGTLRVGDSLTEGDSLHFIGVPSFAPDIFQQVTPEDPMKSKHVKKALESLSEEGVVQIFKLFTHGRWVVGVLGALQLDILKERMESEHGLSVRLTPVPYTAARWIKAEKDDLDAFIKSHSFSLAEDCEGHPVFLSKSAWELTRQKELNPNIHFLKIHERA